MKEGIDAPRVTEWFAAHIEGARPPLSFELVEGGRSNLTYRVGDAAGSQWALRRPPTGHVLPTAHDMGREHRIISALGPTPVPVPPALGFCDDPAVTGAPFYVMGWVDGRIVRDRGAAEQLTLDERRTAAESLVDVLAALHDVDPDAVGLGDLGRKEGYIERQLKRWHTQYEQGKTRELPQVTETYELLRARVPEQGPARVVHGDYRLDNCVLDDAGRVVAVLDWEICTLGDPLADVGLLLVYWGDPHEEGVTHLALPTTVDGFPSRAEIAERYAKLSGRDLSGIDYYVAFAYWKLACILEGVYSRFLGGVTGGDRRGLDQFGEEVEKLVAVAHRAAATLP
jgi:aminoglycoside phosphotransferase (APT) family kinase protein